MTQTLDIKTARVYAIALYDLKPSQEDIEKSRNIVKDCQPLMQVLNCPVVPMEQKLACVERIFPESIATFIKVVCRHHRCALLSEIFNCYSDYADSVKCIQNAVIRCVTLPDERQLEGIKKFLMRRFKADDVRIRIEKDPSLIGGFIIEANGCEMDYSIRGRFKQLEQKLIRR